MKLLAYRSVKLAVVVTVFTAILEVMVAYSLAFLVADTAHELLRNSLLVAGIYVVYGVFMYLNAKLRALSLYHVSQDMKQKTDKWLAALSYQDFHQKDHGERLSVYVNDVNKVLDLTLTKYFSMVEKATVTLFIFGSLFTIHYSMALIALASFAIMAYVPSLFQKALSSHILGVQEAKETYLGKMRELLQGFDTFMENTAFSVFLRKSRQAAHQYATTNLNADAFTALMSACLTLLNSLLTVIALGILSYNVMKGRVPAGAFLSVTALLPNFGSAVMEFLSEKEFYQSGQTLYQNKFGMIANPAFSEPIFYQAVKPTSRILMVKEDLPNDVLQTDVESLVLNDVAVTFDNNQLAFPTELTFDKGQKYAIIGTSGCGKSTLLKILTGQLRDFSGQYEINGEQPSTNLFQQLSYVNQTTFLFNDSIRHNIDLTNQHRQEDLAAMLTMLGLEQFHLEDEIVDNGKNLSGGQRQRLAIARALLRDKSVLILDEATANLDEATSRQIEDYILSTGKMVIMVTHRLTEQLKNNLNQIITLG